MAVHADIVSFGNKVTNNIPGFYGYLYSVKQFKLDIDKFVMFYTCTAGIVARFVTANAADTVYGDEIILESTKREYVGFERVTDTKYVYWYIDSTTDAKNAYCRFFTIIDNNITLGDAVRINSNVTESLTIVPLNDEYCVAGYKNYDNGMWSACVIHSEGLVGEAGVPQGFFTAYGYDTTGIRISDTKVLFVAGYNFSTVPLYVVNVVGGQITSWKNTNDTTRRYFNRLFLRDDGTIDNFYNSSNTTGNMAYSRFVINDDDSVSITNVQSLFSAEYSGNGGVSRINDNSFLIAYNASYNPSARIANISKTDGNISLTDPVQLDGGQNNNDFCIVLSDELAVVQYKQTNQNGFHSVPLTLGLTGTYDITLDLTNTVSNPDNLMEIPVRGTIDMLFEAETGYVLPLDVTVTGATYLWDINTGTLTLSEPYNDITINIVSLSDQSVLVLNLYQNSAEPNRVDKSSYLTKVGTLYGALREESSITNMRITFEQERIPEFNYVGIGMFGRYYYVTDMVAIRHKLWEMTLEVDVLMSYKETILAQTAFIDRNQNEYNPMLMDNCVAVEQGKEVEVIQGTETFVDEWDIAAERDETPSVDKCRYLIMGTAIR